MQKKESNFIELNKKSVLYFQVVASPEDGVVRNEEEIGKDEILDFEAVGLYIQVNNCDIVWL